jgi:hypothetical protein
LSAGDFTGSARTKQAAAPIPLCRVTHARLEVDFGLETEPLMSLGDGKEEGFAEEVQPAVMQWRLDMQRWQQGFHEACGGSEGPQGQLYPRRLAAQCGGDAVDHLVGRQRLPSCQNEGFADSSRTVRGQQQAAHQIRDMNALAPVVARADHHELATVDCPEQFQ